MTLHVIPRRGGQGSGGRPRTYERTPAGLQPYPRAVFADCSPAPLLGRCYARRGLRTVLCCGSPDKVGPEEAFAIEDSRMAAVARTHLPAGVDTSAVVQAPS